MQQGPARAVDQGRRFIELQFPYVSVAEVELDSRLGRTLSRLGEHARRRVDPEHTPARCLGDGDRDAPGPNRKLDQWPVGITGKPDIERDVSGAR